MQDNIGRSVRPARMRELDTVMVLLDEARVAMRAAGNDAQWTDGYPQRSLIARDIEAGHGFVCEEEGRIACYFCFFVGEEPTYARIDGAWQNDAPYGVVHRIASARGVHGAAAFCLDWCLERCGNVRIDTHTVNAPMRRLLEKCAFIPCGTIYLEDGAPRLAYQKCGGVPSPWDCSYRGIAVRYEDRAVHVRSDDVLLAYLGEDGNGSLELARAIGERYAWRLGKPLEIAEKSLALEIVAHAYASVFSGRGGQRLRALPGHLAAALMAFFEKVERHAAGIDCGERAVDTNRWLFDMLAPFSGVLFAILGDRA